MKNAILAALVLSLALLSGCAVVSKEALTGADSTVAIDAVQMSPGAYAGRKVVWGGLILSAENLEKSTRIEVLEEQLGYDYSPTDGASRGRFIIEAKGYLDAAIYSSGKRITVVGLFKGIETRKIGQMDYPYPLIEPLEMRLFEKPMPPYPPDYYAPYYPWPYRPFPPYGPYPYPYPYPWPPHFPAPPAK